MATPTFGACWIGVIAGLGLLLPTGGCASARRAPLPAPPDAAPGIPAAVPVALAEAVPMAAPGPEAVYRNPKIGMVYLRAHQDADGRLLGPQVMYQVVDPGSWNVDAVEQGRGYIPSVNLELPPNQGSPYVMPARGVAPLSPASPLLDPGLAADIVITGLMRPDEKPEAEALARRRGPGSTATYDEQAGWLLLPPPKPP